jgi:hypothetical protein
MDATKTQSGTLDRHLLSAKKYTCQRGAEPGRHHLVIPGDIISERPGDFVGIRILRPGSTYSGLPLPGWSMAVGRSGGGRMRSGIPVVICRLTREVLSRWWRTTRKPRTPATSWAISPARCRDPQRCDFPALILGTDAVGVNQVCRPRRRSPSPSTPRPAVPLVRCVVALGLGPLALWEFPPIYQHYHNLSI